MVFRVGSDEGTPACPVLGGRGKGGIGRRRENASMVNTDNWSTEVEGMLMFVSLFYGLKIFKIKN